jgi:polar amino acid transport system substrate-binding protein
MKIKSIASVALLLTLLVASASAETFKVALPQVPTSGFYTDLFKAVSEVTGATFDIVQMPRARTLYLLENKQVDIVAPLADVRNPKKEGELKYDYSTVLFKSCYILFTNGNKPFTADELKAGNPKNYKVEVDNAFINSYEFTAMGSTNAEASFKKLESGAIDGFISSQLSGDPVLKTLGFKDIKRQLYSYYDVNLGIQKGTKGGNLDKMLNAGITKLKANGKFDSIMGAMIKTGSVYSDWQP